MRKYFFFLSVSWSPVVSPETRKTKPRNETNEMSSQTKNEMSVIFFSVELLNQFLSVNLDLAKLNFVRVMFSSSVWFDIGSFYPYIGRLVTSVCQNVFYLLLFRISVAKFIWF